MLEDIIAPTLQSAGEIDYEALPESTYNTEEDLRNGPVQIIR